MQLAGLHISAEVVTNLAALVRETGGAELADRLEWAIDEQVKSLAVTTAERAVMLAALDDPPDSLAELCAVLLEDHQWRLRNSVAAEIQDKRIQIARLSASLDDALDQGMTDDPQLMEAYLQSLRVARMELEALERAADGTD